MIYNKLCGVFRYEYCYMLLHFYAPAEHAMAQWLSYMGFIN